MNHSGLSKSERAQLGTAIARIGNPWMVGHNYGRVVPIYVLHNLLRARGTSSPDRLHALKSLAVDPNVDAAKLDLPVAARIQSGLNSLIRGTLAPDGRVFRNRRAGGASQGGALLPVLPTIVESTVSDDGLGRRLHELLALSCVREEWDRRVSRLLTPASITDPVTNLAAVLTEYSLDEPHEVAEAQEARSSETQANALDRSIARFMTTLLRNYEEGSRPYAVQQVGIAAYLMAIVRLLNGPLVSPDEPIPATMVFTGMPPGSSQDPLVSHAITSLRSTVHRSWIAMVDAIANHLDDQEPLPGSDLRSRRRQQLRLALANNRFRASHWEALGHLVADLPEDELGDARKFSSAILERGLDFGAPTIIQRFRSLAANIGFVAPDRGAGQPRLVLDTPLLGILVAGTVEGDALEYGQFVTQLRRRVGLIVGVGDNHEFLRDLEGSRLQPANLFQVLHESEEELKRRLLRAGLARTYSDSITEVIRDGL